MGPHPRDSSKLIHRNSFRFWLLRKVCITQDEVYYLLIFRMCLDELAPKGVVGNPLRVTWLFQAGHYTIHAAFWGELGRSLCSLPRFFVCLRSCRTAWTCALPRAVPVVPQHCNTELSRAAREARCVQATVVSVLATVSPMQAREIFFFSLEQYKSPRIYNSLCGFKGGSAFLGSSGLCPSASASSWEMGALEGNEGPADWDVHGSQQDFCGVGTPSWVPTHWATSGNGLRTCWCLTRLRGAHRVQAWGLMAALCSGSHAVPGVPLSFWQSPGICEKAACFSCVSEGLAEFLGCFPHLPASNPPEMSAGNE